MRPYLITFACLCSVLAFVTAVPVPASNQELDVLQIPLSNGKELDVLTLGAKDQEQIVAERNKRTIGLLRELFPDITKQIDGIVNRIIAQVIRVAGPDVLRSLLGNNNRNATPRPNLAADFDDDDEDEDDNDINKLDNNSKSTTATSKINGDDDDDNSRVQIDLPTFPPASSEDGGANKVSSSSSTSTTPITTSTTSSTTPSTTTSSSTTSTTTTTTTSSPIYIISPINPTTSSPTTTTTSTTTSTTPSSPIAIISPTTPITLPDPINVSSTTDPLLTADISFNLTNPLTSSMVNSLATSLRNELSSNSLPDRVVDESQLMAIIDSLNRLLNSTNYFVATRDNFSSSPSTPTTTTTTSSADSTTTPKITKLLPNGATDTQIDLSAINKQLEETIRVARQVKEAEAAAQVVAALQQQQPAQLPIPTPKVEETIQLSFNNELNSLTSNEKPKSISNDLQLSESKSPAIDELTLDSNEDTADLDDRNKSNIFKRFLQFGGGGLAGGSSGGSSSGSGGAGGAGAGGSGNFLFDVVRLFSGSVQTQAGDESANSANSVSSSSDSDSDSDSNRSNDGYTEGIPGPVTRLVVLANRGLANLVQDLILRVAATSEKFVNFKAKLITALI